MNTEPTAKMKCPFCAEEIPAAAIVCRFCGRDLKPPAPPIPPPRPAPPPAPPEKERSNGFRNCLIVMATIVILAAIYNVVSKVYLESNDSSDSNKHLYGKEMSLRGGYYIGRTEADLLEVDNKMTVSDTLSIQQMISGGRVWKMPDGSRVKVMGRGDNSNCVEVRFMDGRTGWVHPGLLE